MKKLISLLLAVLCLFSLCACGSSAPSSVPAAEAEQAQPADEAPAEEVPAEPEPEPEPAMPPYEPLETPFGFRFEYPEEYQNLKGELAWWITSLGNNFVDGELYYVEVPEAEREAFRAEAARAVKNTGGLAPEWRFNYKAMPLFSFIGLYDSEADVEYYETVTPLEYMNNFYGERAPGATRATVPVYLETLAFENGWKLLAQRPELFTYEGEQVPLMDFIGYLSDEECRKEALALKEKPELFVAGLKEAPWELPGQVGSKVSFEAQTLDGETVTSEDLFGGHKVTMVNVWATWCGPCIKELKDLEKLNASLADKGCQVIGVCQDAADSEALAEAIRILEEKGVSYPNLVFNSDLLFANVNVFPSTFFIAEDGTILTKPVEGANLNAYNSALKKALSQVG